MPNEPQPSPTTPRAGLGKMVAQASACEAPPGSGSGPAVKLENLVKRFGDFLAVDRVDAVEKKLQFSLLPTTGGRASAPFKEKGRF